MMPDTSPDIVVTRPQPRCPYCRARLAQPDLKAWQPMPGRCRDCDADFYEQFRSLHEAEAAARAD